MGNKGAREFGMEEAPNTIEEAITKTTAKVSCSRSHLCVAGLIANVERITD
jgi:hypothetical protein